MEKVAVLGLGYMGLPTASLLATHGYNVLGVDVNQNKVDSIKKRQVPFDEPGLTELVLSALDTNNLNVSTTLETSDIFIIAVPTPITEGKKAELSYVKSAAEMIAPFLKKGDLVILESTVPPATCINMLKPILEQSGLIAGKDFYLSHCPERAIPGNTMYELVNNDRIIGGVCPKSTELTKNIYSKFVKGEILETDTTTAETVKLMENTTRDINIALANEFAKIAEEIGVNIWEAIALTNHHPRVKVLSPGPGVGGHCIAIDPWFLTENTENAMIIKTARQINDGMPSHVIELAKSMLSGIENPTISILGVAYKADVDDARETPAKHIIDQAKELGWIVKVNDPYVKKTEFPGLLEIDECLQDTDCIILVTNHKEYRNIDPAKYTKLVKSANLVDTRNFLDQEKWENAGFKVRILGNGKTVSPEDYKIFVRSAEPTKAENSVQ